MAAPTRAFRGAHRLDAADTEHHARAPDLPLRSRLYRARGGDETARALAEAGAEVVIAARKPDLAEAVISDINRTAAGRTTFEMLDLADLASVRALAERWSQRRLDLLVNNAGVMACPLDHTQDGGRGSGDATWARSGLRRMGAATPCRRRWSSESASSMSSPRSTSPTEVSGVTQLPAIARRRRWPRTRAAKSGQPARCNAPTKSTSLDFFIQCEICSPTTA